MAKTKAACTAAKTHVRRPVSKSHNSPMKMSGQKTIEAVMKSRQQHDDSASTPKRRRLSVKTSSPLMSPPCSDSAHPLTSARDSSCQAVAAEPEMTQHQDIDGTMQPCELKFVEESNEIETCDQSTCVQDIDQHEHPNEQCDATGRPKETLDAHDHSDHPVRVFPLFDLPQQDHIQMCLKAIVQEDHNLAAEHRDAQIAAHNDLVASGKVIPFEPVRSADVDYFFKTTGKGCAGDCFGLNQNHFDPASSNQVQVGTKRADVCEFFGIQQSVMQVDFIERPALNLDEQVDDGVGDNHQHYPPMRVGVEECALTISKVDMPVPLTSTQASPRDSHQHDASVGDFVSSQTPVKVGSHVSDTSASAEHKNIASLGGDSPMENLENHTQTISTAKHPDHQCDALSHPCRPVKVMISDEHLRVHVACQGRRMKALADLFDWPVRMIRKLAKLATDPRGPDAVMISQPPETPKCPDYIVPVPDQVPGDSSSLTTSAEQEYIDHLQKTVQSMSFSTSFSGIDTPSTALAMMAVGIGQELHSPVSTDTLSKHIADNKWAIEWYSKSQDELLRLSHGPKHVFRDISEFWMDGIGQRIGTLIEQGAIDSVLTKLICGPRTVKSHAFCLRCQKQCHVSHRQAIVYFS